LQCENSLFYAGITQNIKRRFEEHRHSKGGHFTNYNRPEEIVHVEGFYMKNAAEMREQQIKRWSWKKKLALIHQDTK